MFDRQDNGISRRGFLAASGVTALGITGLRQVLAADAAASQPATNKPVLPYGKLGRTNYPVTLVSFGAILLKGNVGTRVLQLGIDRGINLLHTSASYGNGSSLAACGELFKSAPAYRDKVFLAVKSYTPEKESEIDAMLRAMSIDHVDVVLTELHDPDPRRVEAIQKQQDALKKKGKAKHTGFVCHGAMNEVLEMVVEKHAKYFDVCLLAMKMLPNITADKPQTDEAGERFIKNLKALRAAGVGILSMKSGARKAVTRGKDVYLPHLKAYLQAGVDTMLTSLNTLDEVDMVTKLELKSLDMTPKERQSAIDFHDSLADACHMCGQCKQACPLHLPVNDLMRFRMYHQDYGMHEHARAEYAALGIDFHRAAVSCGDCTTCTEACPVKLASSGMIRQVADLLS